jgi:hypothetical protein
MYSVRVQGLPTGSRLARLALIACLAAFTGGCEVEWGGATVELEDPSPPPEESAAAETAGEQAELPLPEGPLLWVVRSTDPGGDVVALPVARLEDGLPVDIAWPEAPTTNFRERFQAAFEAEGTELVLGSGGSRIGSLVLGGPTPAMDAGCPSVAAARALVLPGTRVPPVSFALGPNLTIPTVGSADGAAVDNRMRTFGPILAEQLLRQGGEDRPFLAQRADLVAFTWPGDERPAMAATYLINDTLAGPGPSGAAVSLFFLARFGPRGYEADWSEMRTYSGEAGSREIFTWLNSAPLPGGRLDFVVRWDGAVRRLAASVDSDDPNRGIAWTESARCPSLELLGIPTAAGAPDGAEAPAG